MRICLAYQHALASGGYPRDARWLATALHAAGAEVALVCDDGPVREGLADGVELVRLDSLPSMVHRWDLVHVFGLLMPAHIPLLEAAHVAEVPTVISPLAALMPSSVNRTLWKRAKKEAFIRFHARTLRRVSALHLLSPSETIQWPELWRTTPRFFAGLGVFPPAGGCDPDALASPVPGQVVFFGRNDVYQKGIDILLRAVARAGARSDTGGRSIQLVVAGRPHGASERFIARRVQRLGLGSKVRVLGPLEPQVAEHLMCSSEALVFLSRFDGPPRPVREAIALGVPVIVSYESNLGTAVAAHGAGAAVALDPGAIAEEMVHLARDPARSAAWRENVPRLRHALSWERLAHAYLDGYGSALRDPPRNA